MSAQDACPPERRARGLVELLILGCVAAVYANSLNGPWLLDDLPLIALNPAMRTASGWLRIWTSDYWASTGAAMGLYRPLPLMTYALTWALAGGWTFPYHLTNVLLHAVVAVMVWRVLLGGAHTWAAVLCALLFALHPVHAEAVANVAGRSELLLAAGFLCAIWCRAVLVQGRCSGVPLRRFMLHAGFAMACACMVLSKETGVLLALFFVAQDAVERPWRERPGAVGTLVGLYASLCAVVGVSLLLRWQAVGLLPAGGEVHGWRNRLALSASAALQAARLLLAPVEHRAAWRIPDLAAVTPVHMALGCAVMAALACVSVGALVSRRRALLPGVLMLLALLPMLHLRPNVIWVWERGLYLPCAALVWWVCLGVQQLCPCKRSRAVVGGFLLVLACAAAARTVAVSRLYADEERFWRYEAVHNASDSGTLISLSGVLMKQGSTAEAVELRERAWELDPARGVVLAALVDAYLAAGRQADARKLLEAHADAPLAFHTDVQRGQLLRALSDKAERAGAATAAQKYRAAARQRSR